MSITFRQRLKQIVRARLSEIGMRVPLLARVCLRGASLSPRLYMFAARAEGMAPLVPERIWFLRAGPLAGFKLTGLLLDEVAPILSNSMEMQCSARLEGLSLRSAVALDIGSSYGYYSLLLSRLVGSDGHIYGFEPDWRSYERLTHNLALNGCGNVTPVPICLSNVAGGLARWHSTPARPWESKLVHELFTIPSPPRAVVPVTTVDEFARVLGIADQVRLMKVDVEGEELQVLEGASNLLHSSKPALLLELHGADTAQRIFRLLSQCGYHWEVVEYQSEVRQHILAFA